MQGTHHDQHAVVDVRRSPLICPLVEKTNGLQKHDRDDQIYLIYGLRWVLGLRAPSNQ